MGSAESLSRRQLEVEQTGVKIRSEDFVECICNMICAFFCYLFAHKEKIINFISVRNFHCPPIDVFLAPPEKSKLSVQNCERALSPEVIVLPVSMSGRGTTALELDLELVLALGERLCGWKLDITWISRVVQMFGQKHHVGLDLFTDLFLY